MTEIAPGNGIYPAGAAARSRWITALRGSRRQTDPERAYAAIHEPELDAQGVLRPTNVLFLTNTECPYRCLMCGMNLGFVYIHDLKTKFSRRLP